MSTHGPSEATDPLSGNALPLGLKLNEFEIVRLLGEGGFGIVYEARDSLLERKVAIKEFMPTALALRGAGGSVQVRSERLRETFDLALRSFVNEAKLLAAFDHPALVKVYRFWEANGTAYMVMPFLEGITLRDHLRKLPSPPDEAWLRALLGPLTDALAMLHSTMTFHRDIAPDNVMLLSTGQPVLLDFGAARRVISDATQALTVILKPGYAPIEQYAEMPSLRQGPWTDIYALAAVIRYAVTAQPLESAVSRMVSDQVEPLTTTHYGRYSKRFLDAINHALAVRPEDRTSSIEQFREEIGLTTDDGTLPDMSPGEDALALPSHGLQDAPVVADLADDPLAPGDLRQASKATETNPLIPPTISAPVGGLDAMEVGPKEEPIRTMMAPALIVENPSSVKISPDAIVDRTQIIASTSAQTFASAIEAQIFVMASQDPDQLGRIVPIDAVRLEIGRDEAAGLRISDPQCSRRHAAVERLPNGYRLIDFGSANGTVVNGRLVGPGDSTPLLFGATIRIGATVLRFNQRAGALADYSGQVFAGRYVLRERLRVSPKGAVYAATLKGSDILLAVKMLAGPAARIADYRHQFEAESAIAKQLRHPHICELRDYGVGRLGSGDAELPFLCYSLMSGGNLEDRLLAKDLPSPEVAREWIADLADALHYAHERRVVHANVKPSAVCFDDGGHLYLTDFAVAEALSGLHLGSPGFMAPEQWDGLAPTARTDQFALAALAYLLLVGARPFEGQEDPAIRARNFRRGAEPAHLEAQRANRPPLPTAVSQVLQRALSTDPVRRFESVPAFAVEFNAAFGPRRGGGRAPEVFISYQRDASAGWATLIHTQLRDKYEIRSFLDSKRLDGAVRFPEKVAEAVRGCEVFVCLLASTTLKAPWVIKEIQIAHEAGRPMIPIFQESFKRHASVPDDPAVHALLHYDGLELLDRRNIHIDHTISDLARQIRLTLQERQG